MDRITHTLNGFCERDVRTNVNDLRDLADEAGRRVRQATVVAGALVLLAVVGLIAVGFALLGWRS